MKRLKFTQVFLYLVLGLIVLRLWFWQVLQSSDLTARAEQQRVSSKTLLAPRGSILFSDGSVLASTQPLFSMFAQPKIIKDKQMIAKLLAEFFWNIDNPNGDLVEVGQRQVEIDKLKLSLMEKLSKDLYWVSLNRKLNFDQKTQIEKMNLGGIGFDTILSRFYPEGSSSAHLLGFVAADAYGEDRGYFGLEGFYNGELKGKNGSLVQDKDAEGLPILIGNYQQKDPKPGKTLTLNIDRTVQHFVEERLKKGIQEYGAKNASAVVMDPKTGAVLALAAYPNYDPGEVLNYPKEYFKNPMVADGYEPGSTFKVLIMAAGINEKLVTPETECDSCGGPVSIGGFQIRTWNDQYEPNTTMDNVIIHSDNTGMVFVARKLGLDKLYSYLKSFGVGEPTGVDLQDEQVPALRPKESWRDIDLATASFGQGISLNGLQVAKAVATLANGGYLMEPHIVKQIQDDKGTVTIAPNVLAHPISSETAKTVTQMMVDAVEKGEAKFFKLKGFKIAGKTGTAQIPVAGHYDSTKTIASFVGFAPADDPKFLILVRYDQPSSSIYGAETAAPTFFDIAKQLFVYYGIAPDDLN